MMAILTAAALMAGACSSDDEAADSESTVEDSATSTEAAAAETEEPTDSSDTSEPADEESTAAAGATPEVTCDGPLDPAVPVRMGDVQSASQAGQYLAMDLGFFAERGIEPELVQVQSSGAQIALFATGDLDIATGNPTAGYFNAIANDVGIKFIGTWVTQEEGDGTQAMIIRQDLVDSGEITELSDIAGHRIALPGLDDTFNINTYLSAAGLGLDDITMEAMAYPDMLAALTNGSIDGAILLEPFVGIAEAQGVATKLVPQGDVIQGPVTFIVANTQMLDDDPQVGACFMEAFLEGQSAYMEAFFGSGEGRDEAVEILTQRTRLTDPADWPRLLDRQGLPKVATDGAIDPEDLDRFQEYYINDGTLGEYLPPEETMDTRFVPPRG